MDIAPWTYLASKLQISRSGLNLLWAVHTIYTSYDLIAAVCKLTNGIALIFISVLPVRFESDICRHDSAESKDSPTICNLQCRDAECGIY